jgi:predicted MFS family arabinose efflux permease
VFFAGPIDNLLLPGHLSAKNAPASTFGDMFAVLGLGLAAGLWFAQSSTASTLDGAKRRGLVVLGLAGFAGQLALILWLPQQWLLLGGLFLCATCFAPLLPMLEAAMLTAAPPAQRTLMLAALSTLLSLADALGTISLGGLISATSSSTALAICLAVAVTVVLVCCLWPKDKPA